MPPLVTILAPVTGWQACLTLDFQPQGSRTILGTCTHRGPLQVQRPFYPEGETVCHVAVLHPPGGVVGGDALQLDVTLATSTHGLITTPAASKFYRSAGPTAHQRQHLAVASGATLEWLPQENIVYAGAKVHAVTRIELQGDARCIGWELLCLGRPAAGEIFTTGEYRQDLELWRDGEPLYLERGRYLGGEPILNAYWGLQGQPVSATLWCSPVAPEGVQAIRTKSLTSLAPSPSTLVPPRAELATVTMLDGVLICRYLGPSTVRARQLFIQIWSLLRPMVLNRSPCPSRFWNT